MAQNTTNPTGRVDGRTTRHSGYEPSQRAREQIEEGFAFTAAAVDLARLRNLAFASA